MNGYPPYTFSMFINLSVVDLDRIGSGFNRVCGSVPKKPNGSQKKKNENFYNLHEFLSGGLLDVSSGA